MHYAWEDQTIQWMLDAAEYTGFYKNMSELLLPYIRQRGTLCDMGCGMALTDMELAAYIGKITCVDISTEVLEFAEKEAAERGLNNLSFVNSDGMKTEGKWDTVIALFHGRADRTCAPYLRMSNDRFVFVTHAAGIHHVAGFCENAAEAAEWLDAQGWQYTRQDAVLEFGQPHRNIEEALAGTAAFHRDLTQKELEERVFGQIVETGREDFPYYTPKTRAFAIFDVPRAGNERFL